MVLGNEKMTIGQTKAAAKARSGIVDWQLPCRPGLQPLADSELTIYGLAESAGWFPANAKG